MAIEEALVSHLVNDEGVAALVVARVSPMAAGQADTEPYITYQRISTGRFPHMGAASGLVQSRFQLDVWAASANSAASVSDAIREALDGMRIDDALGSGDEAMSIQSVTLIDQSAGYETPKAGEQHGTFRESMDFDLTYAESVPTFS